MWFLRLWEDFLEEVKFEMKSEKRRGISRVKSINVRNGNVGSGRSREREK